MFIHSDGRIFMEDFPLPMTEPELNIATVRFAAMEKAYPHYLQHYFAFESLSGDIGMLPDTLITFAVSDWIDRKTEYPNLISSLLLSFGSVYVQ